MGPSSEVLDCSGSHTGGTLTSVPTDIPTTVVHVWLSHNQIGSISATDFAGLRHMKYLYLDNNLITSIDSQAFSTLNSMVFLLLNNNALTTLPDGLFKNMVVLEALDLRANALGALRPGMFEGMPKLIYLNLFGNSIGEVSCGTFNQLSTVGFLNMGENPSVCEVHEKSTGLLTCTCSASSNGGFGYCSAVEHDACGAQPPILEGYANAATTALPSFNREQLLPLDHDRFTTAGSSATDGTNSNIEEASQNTGTGVGSATGSSDSSSVMLAGLIGGMAVLVAAVGVTINARSHAKVVRAEASRSSGSQIDLQWDDGATMTVYQGITPWNGGSDLASSVSTLPMQRNMDEAKWRGSLWQNDGATHSQSAIMRPRISNSSSAI